MAGRTRNQCNSILHLIYDLWTPIPGQYVFLYIPVRTEEKYHPVFLITANTKKILTRIRQLFSDLLDAQNLKIWVKLKFNEPFLSYQLRSTANPALWAALFWAVLLCPQKGLVRFQFKSYFWISCIK